MRRVLIVRAGALGDLLLLRPAIAALQAAGRTVDLLAPSGPAAALTGSGPGDAADLLPWESAAHAPLLTEDGDCDAATADRLRRYDAAIACTRSAALARNLARFVGTVVAHDPAPPADGTHAAAWLSSCLPGVGVTAAAPFPVLAPSAEEQRQADAITDRLPASFLAIHPGSGSAAKNWPADRFASLVRRLAPQRWLLVRGPADGDAAEALSGIPGACVARELPLRVLAAVLCRAGAYVGNDSGVTHLAAASGARTIALFGPTDPRVWAPLGPRVQVVAASAMDAISVEEVAAAAVPAT